MSISSWGIFPGFMFMHPDGVRTQWRVLSWEFWCTYHYRERKT